MAPTAKATSTTRSASQNMFNSPDIDGGYRGSGHHNVHICAAEYDFAVDGAIPAAGSVGLGISFPINAIIFTSFVHVLVVPVGPTNIGVSVENDFDLIASAAIIGAPWATALATVGTPSIVGGLVIGTPGAFGTLTNWIKTTAAREIAVKGTGAASTAGRFITYALWTNGRVI